MQDLVTHVKSYANNLFSALILVLVLLNPIQLHANDTTARVGAGGLTLLKSENIRVLEEVLEISTSKIKVSYRFLNESDHDIQTTVAFPLPDYEYDPDSVEFKQLRAYRKFKDFKNWTNGKLVPVKRDQKALIGKTDITHKLRNIGLTDDQIFETFGESTDEGTTNFTIDQENKISELFSQISKKENDTTWKVSETIYWEQIFPKGKEIEVVHEYTPNQGNAPNYMPDLYSDKTKLLHPIPKIGKNPKEACLENGTFQDVQRKIKSILNKTPYAGILVYLYDVEYILGTGRNWKGPIGSFTLRIKKDFPKQMISLCSPEKPKQINPTSLEYKLKDYTPQDKLVVYFITVDKY